MPFDWRAAASAITIQLTRIRTRSVSLTPGVVPTTFARWPPDLSPSNPAPAAGPSWPTSKVPASPSATAAAIRTTAAETRAFRPPVEAAASHRFQQSGAAVARSGAAACSNARHSLRRGTPARCISRSVRRSNHRLPGPAPATHAPPVASPRAPSIRPRGARSGDISASRSRSSLVPCLYIRRQERPDEVPCCGQSPARPTSATTGS